ncbi:MAG: hypothetical protein P0Y53_18930 [Candidatus Pseudobacter hemicellulosilyticus]|uniref:Uncharacterized protein n=1 Tax=Candidatus Pseudobacter hemicellulosilyticus TaxID=3121375 RepID=A0AAJ6BGW5_9BACT|nr:MAG: hypothetical protein P0Y53_18930 [Pseudobacter sp.]
MFKQWIIFSLLFIGLATGTRAQVSLTLQVPPMGVFVKNQLWNMLLANGGSTRIIRVSLVLLDVKTNQPLLSAISGPITLNNGSRLLQGKDFEPVHYEYSSQATLTSLDQQGLLPVGSYQACYTILDAQKTNMPLAENCILLNVDPLSPPLLNTPEDGSSLLTAYPQFTWLPPAPLALFSDPAYELLVVEVLPGQAPAEAIQQNVPVYSSGRIRYLYSQYPASRMALDTARTYAWRIVALNGFQAVSLSETWTFRVAGNHPAKSNQSSDSYIELKRNEDAFIASAGDQLKLSWDNAAGNKIIRYTISSLEDAGNPVVQEGELTVKQGHNRIPLTLQRKKFSRNKVYLFRFRDERNEWWSVKFTWTPTPIDILPARP